MKSFEEEFEKEDFIRDIEGFGNWSRFKIFREAVGKHPDFKPIKPKFMTRYGGAVPTFWFRHKPTGEAWFLVEPDGPMTGAWRKAVPERSAKWTEAYLKKHPPVDNSLGPGEYDPTLKRYPFAPEDFLREIEPFENFDHYGDFLLALEKNADFERLEPPAESPYGSREVRWFRHKLTGDLWTLIRPAHPKTRRPDDPVPMGAWKKAEK